MTSSPAPSCPAPSRKALRTQLRQDRAAFVAGRGTAFPLDQQCLDLLRRAAMVGGYAPMRGEPDPTPYLFWCAARGIATCLPYFSERGAAMTFRRWSPGEPLADSTFGFLQPGADAADALPDALLVPLVGFDARGNRIGQGAGHYDRYFAAHAVPVRIGVAWSVQRRDAIAAEAWDVPMTSILTESGFWPRLQMEADA